MAIRLPNLTQNVKIDTKDLDKAILKAAQFKVAMDKALDIDDAKFTAQMARIRASMMATTDEAREFAREMAKVQKAMEQTNRQTSIGTTQTRKYRDVMKSTKDHVLQASKNVDRYGDSMSRLEKVTSRTAVATGNFNSEVTGVRDNVRATVKSNDDLFNSNKKLGLSFRALKLGGIGAGLLVAIPAIAQLAPVLVGLGAGLAPLSGFAALLPGLVAAFAGLAGVIALVATNNEQLGEAFKSFGADMQSVQQIAQDNMNPAIMEFLDTLRNMKPVIEEVTGAISGGLGRAVESFSAILASPAFQTDFLTVGQSLGRVFDTLGQAGGQALRGLTSLAAGASPFFERVAEAVRQGAQNFAAFIDRVRASGQLEAFLDAAFKTAQRLWGMLKDLGSTLVSLGRIANESGLTEAIFGGLEGGIAGAKKFVEENKALLTTTFQNIAENVKALGPVFSTLFREIFTTLGNVDLKPIAGLLTDLIPIIANVADSFVDLINSGIAAFGPAIKAVAGPAADFIKELVDTVGGVLKGLEPQFTAFGEAIGRVFSALGAALPSLGPILKTVLDVLLNVGTAIANVVTAVLPAFTGALKVISPILSVVGSAIGLLVDAISLIPGPVFAAVAAFLAFKAIAGTSLFSGMIGGLTKLSGSLGFIAQGGGAVGAAATAGSVGAGKLAGALSKVGSALPAVGIGVGLLAFAIGDVVEKQQEAVAQGGKWAESLRAGGTAAQNATKEIEAAADKLEEFKKQSVIEKSFGLLTGDTGESLNAQRSMEALQQAQDDYIKNTPLLTQAQDKVDQKFADLQVAVDKYGVGSSQATAASKTYQSAQDDLAQAQADVAAATQSATDAIAEYRETAFNTAIDVATATTRNSDAQIRLGEAITGVNDANATYGVGSVEFVTATNNLATAATTAADAAGTLAVSQNATATEAEKATLFQDAYLTSLLSTATAAGTSLPEATRSLILSMLSTASATGTATGAFGELQKGVISVPDSKSVIVSALTQEAEDMLVALGFKVTHMDDGTVKVEALTAEAEAALNHVARNRQSTVTVTYRTTGGSTGQGGIFANGVEVGNARGGIWERGGRGTAIKRFAGGGIHSNMSPNIAAIVPPKTFRVIGDRTANDEAFIPITGSKQSAAILHETAKRMGYHLQAFAQGGINDALASARGNFLSVRPQTELTHTAVTFPPSTQVMQIANVTFQVSAKDLDDVQKVVTVLKQLPTQLRARGK